MTDLGSRRLALPTGVELDVTLGGEGEPILFLHGFPESRRSWRHQIADLAQDHQVAVPDQRGYARSSKPPEVADYAIDKLVGDVLALADALGWERFTLAAHDWGGAVGWAAALKHGDRIARLIIANAPHPLIFQRSLIDDQDQRAASQYITALRAGAVEALAATVGLEVVYDKLYASHVPPGLLTEEDRAATLDEWSQPGALTAMVNWYRAADIKVPLPHLPAHKPLWARNPLFPKVKMPTLVVWGTGDEALLPVQLEGLDDLVEDLTLERIDAGHFVQWEKPAEATAAIRRFLAARPLSP